MVLLLYLLIPHHLVHQGLDPARHFLYVKCKNIHLIPFPEQGGFQVEVSLGYTVNVIQKYLQVLSHISEHEPKRNQDH